jgi:hypothetical protein
MNPLKLLHAFLHRQQFLWRHKADVILACG